MVAFSTLLASSLVLPLLASGLAVTSKTALTPFGERPVANVHTVPAGGKIQHVGNQVQVVDAKGTLLHVAENSGTKVRDEPTPASKGSLPATLQNGWIAYAYWYNTGTSPIKSFTTTWTVPPIPATNNGQTLFTFNSIEPASGDAIIQPVLQYGPSAAGGGAYYAVASWYLVGSAVYHTTPVRVRPGQTLTGAIYLTGGSSTSYNYITSFTNIPATSLNVFGAAQLVWATETLEVYGVQYASDFSPGSTVFSNINIKTSAGTPNVAWTPVSSVQDNVVTTVNSQGATNAKITIKYPV
ncbi:hypothetical protein DL93DRAFT_2167757 [Clavulina sp. PMI_390]|nr:hypothetical protein DL93DRAFT_2167757 [Clavulina sp. PMI_390]